MPEYPDPVRPEDTPRLPELPSSSDDLSFHYPSRLRALVASMGVKITLLGVVWAIVQFFLWLYGDEIKPWIKARIASLNLGEILYLFLSSLIDNLPAVATLLAVLAALALFWKAYKETGPKKRGLSFSEWQGIPVLRVRPGHKIEHKHDVAVEVEEISRPTVESQRAKRYLEDEDILLAHLGRELVGKTFVRCRLYGPAVLALGPGPFMFSNMTIDLPDADLIDEILLEVSEGSKLSGGFIAMRGCSFDGCALFGVSFIGTRKTFDAFVRPNLRIWSPPPTPLTPDKEEPPPQ